MAPLIKDGARVHVNKSLPCAPGDLVVLYFRPETVPPGTLPAQIKRLASALPPFSLPYREHPESEGHHAIAVEILNPPRRGWVMYQDLLAIHHCVGEAVS